MTEPEIDVTPWPTCPIHGTAMYVGGNDRACQNPHCVYGRGVNDLAGIIWQDLLASYRKLSQYPEREGLSHVEVNGADSVRYAMVEIGHDPLTGRATAFVYGNAERFREVAEMLERIDAFNPRRHWFKDRVEYKNLKVDEERFKRERLGYWPESED